MYLCGVEKIIESALLEKEILDLEFVALKDWVYFHEVLGKFSLMHWTETLERHDICYQGPKSPSIPMTLYQQLEVTTQIPSTDPAKQNAGCSWDWIFE
jgi:hypothetical protein